MSKTIDEKVLEMRLDNSNFEKNAATSIGTLAKLKQSLNLTGASKGLEQVNAAAGKVNMGGLGSAVETVTAKFSALQVMGVTALANITNSVINAGKNFVNALTIAPVADGFQEYEMTLNAVQTTMAGTGKTAKEVEAELKKLDEYADKTVYSTADMLNNLPKFTNAGVELEKATTAMIGISNATALAGGDAGKASIAFYNLGQAIGTGYLSRMDYNSINNAGIATMEWKEQMVEAAIAQGTLTKTGEDAYTAGKKTFTLQQLFIDGLQEQWATTDVMMKVFGDYGDETTEIGKKSYAAAQDIKTFSMMMDSLKATAGTGWKDTWQTIFGGLDEAKEFWTGLTNTISGIITSMSDWRNNLLDGALNNNPFSNIMDRISEIIKPAQKAAEAVNKTIDTIENLDEIARKVIRGDYKNTDTGRRENLMAEGYNWAIVQNRVNEMLGNTKRHSVEAAQAELELYQAEHGLIEKGEELNETRADSVDALVEMTDAQLKELGLTDDEIKAFRELAKVCELAGLKLSDVVSDPSLLNGRNLLINGFKNIGEGISEFAKVVKQAWQSIFPPKTIEERAAQLHKLLAIFHGLTNPFKNLIIDTGKVDEQGNAIMELSETGDKLMRTFKGVFAVLSVVSDILGGGFKLAFKAVQAVLGYFDIDILDITAAIGDALVKFREMTDVTKLFSKAIEFIAPKLKQAVETMKGWADEFKNLPQVQKAISKIKEAFSKFKDMDFKEIGKNIIDGLKNGLGDGAKKVVDKIVEVAKDIITRFCEILGIHSPSREFFEIGQNIIQGLVNGLQNGISWVVNTIKGIAAKCVEFFNGIDWGSLFAIGVSAGMVYFIKKMADVFETLSGPIDAITDILGNCADVVENVSAVVKNFAKLEKAVAFNIQMDGIQKLAIAVAILAGTIIVLTFIDPLKLVNSVVIIALLAGVLVGLAVAMEKISKASVSIGKDGVQMGGLKSGLLAIAASLLIVAAVVKIIGGMDSDAAIQGFAGLVGITAVLVAFIAICSKLVKNKSALYIDKVSALLKSLSVSLLIIAVVTKILASMTWGDMGKAAAGIGGFVVIVGALISLTKLSGKQINSVGPALLKISGAIAILAITAKLIAGMSWGDMGKAAVGIGGLVGVIAILTLITRLAGGKLLGDIGDTLIKISGAMILLTITAKMLAGMEWNAMGKALVGLMGLAGVIAVLVGIVRLVGRDAPKIAGTLLAMSISIGILAGVAVILSLINLEGLAKGIIAVGLLSSFMALMIFATRGASECKDNLMMMAIAIGVMTASVAALSLIDPGKLAGATIALGALMGMFALMAKTAGAMQKQVVNLTLMIVAVGVIAGMLYLLSTLPIKSTLATSASLSMLLLSLSTSMTIISKLGKISPMALVSVGVMTLVVVVLARILYQLQDLPVESTLATATSLSVLLLSLSASCVILGVAGKFGIAALAGIGILAALIVGIGGLIVGIGALVTEFPKLEEFLNKGIPILEKIGVGIGSFVGGIVQGFGASVATLLPIIGEQLTLFMDSIQGFITGASGITTDVLVGIGVLTAAILLLTAANFISGITQFLPFVGSLWGMGVELGLFMYAVRPFLAGLQTVDPAAIESAKALAEMVLVLTTANLLQGITRFITGGTSFADFGAQLVPFGVALTAFSNTVKGRIDENAVTAAANAGSIMAEMAKTIPNTGGLLGFFAGDNDMATFGVQLVAFGGAIATFSSIVKDRIDENAVTAAANAGSMMVEMAKTIPNTGGVLSFFAGDNDMATFGAQLVAFGSSIAAFSSIVKDSIDEDAIKAAAAAGSTMVELANTIPNTGGLVTFFTGDNDFTTFGLQLVVFGKAMKSYSKSVTDIDTDSISASVIAATELAKLQNSLGETGGLFSIFTGDSGLDTFGDNLKKFGKAMVAYAKSVKDVESSSLSASTKAFESLLEMAKSADGVDFEGMGSFGKSLKKLGESGVKKFVSAFENGEKNVKNAGKDLIESAIDGVKSKESAFDKAAKKVAKSGADAAADKKSSFKSAGKDLGDGLVEGIEAKEDDAYDAGYALGQAAVRGEKDGQASNSPSKLTILAGKWLGEGLVVGIGNMTKAVYNAGHGLGESATQSISSTIARVGDMIGSDIDAQPTIRPVLDLSGVSSGVNALNGMLDTDRTIGLMSNINSISALANSRQNGNEEVVSALNKLNKTMSNLPSGNNYNINGISYSRDTEVSDAVNVLVRATMMEGRV